MCSSPSLSAVHDGAEIEGGNLCASGSTAHFKPTVKTRILSVAITTHLTQMLA